MRLGPAAVVLLLASSACAPVISYTPVDPRYSSARIDPEDVEVYPQDGPDWDYTLAGDFQEASRDSVPGGRPGLLVLLRQLGAEEGCDGVIVGGNVSRFSGLYVSRGRGRWSDGSRLGGSKRPLIERFGIHALCVTRAVPLAPWAHRVPLAPRTPDEFFSF